MPERVNNSRRSCVFLDLNTLEYTEALDLQQALLAAKLNDPSEPDRLLYVEHPPVFTLGRRGGRENLTVSEDFLGSRGIDIIQTDRGGNITFHGPGQAVLYPIMDLGRAKIGVADFVYGLEEIMRLTVQEFGIQASRDTKNHGLWVGNSKIGSVGISIKRNITLHGLALNVCPDLSFFSWINPCGLDNVAMTSIAREAKPESLTHQALMHQVREKFVHYFSRIFDYTVIRK